MAGEWLERGWPAHAAGGLGLARHGTPLSTPALAPSWYLDPRHDPPRRGPVSYRSNENGEPSPFPLSRSHDRGSIPVPVPPPAAMTGMHPHSVARRPACGRPTWQYLPEGQTGTVPRRGFCCCARRPVMRPVCVWERERDAQRVLCTSRWARPPCTASRWARGYQGARLPASRPTSAGALGSTDGADAGPGRKRPAAAVPGGDPAGHASPGAPAGCGGGRPGPASTRSSTWSRTGSALAA